MCVEDGDLDASRSEVCAMNVSKTTSILVTGASGQLGSRLEQVARSMPDVTFIGLSQRELDVCDEQAVLTALEEHRPEVVIHCAAYTAVDRAESEEGLARLVNGDAVGWVASACKAVDATMIYISTDYVFGEVPHQPLSPEMPTGPLGAYGRTKLAGEQAFLESGVQGAIVRVAWLYDAEGHNFMNTMLRLAQTHGELRVVNDQHGVPTSVPVLAEALLDMAKRGGEMPQGIWHYAHQGHTTWHGFATEIMRMAGLDVPVHPVSSDAFPAAAVRPAWSVLDGEPLRQEMGWPAIDWREGLRRCWQFKKDV